MVPPAPSCAPLLAVAAAAGLWAYIARPLPDRIPLIRTVDYMVPETEFYGPEAAAAREAGQPQRAAQVLSEAVQWLGPRGAADGPRSSRARCDERKLADWTANLYRRYAAVLRDLNLPQLADEQDRRAAGPRGRRQAITEPAAAYRAHPHDSACAN